ncbi:MAG: tRNA pseudouridine(13) synthase TruD [Pseudomonadota bacterium]
MIDPGLLRAALDPPRAHGAPAVRGRMRETPEDFLVEEELGFEPSGAGTHVLLRVRKRDANTQWVARELARLAGCRPMDVGYAGLKDRRAVARQWFSVPRGRRAPGEWIGAGGEGFEVLEAHAHDRKLPRGALAGNRFTLRLRGVEGGRDLLEARLAAVAREGVPNYFGPQRFGRGGANLAHLGRAIDSLDRRQRSFVLSAARSLIFNAVLAERVTAGNWNRLLPGDVANLDGRGSIFQVAELDDTLTARCERMELHPTGPLWGRGTTPASGSVRLLEERVASELEAASRLVCAVGMRHERRSLRLPVRDLEHEWRTDDELTLRFRLGKGSFATTVLRELGDFAQPDAGEAHEEEDA